MFRDTLPLAPSGEMLLAQFTEAIGHFTDLVTALSTEVTGPAGGNLEITDLDTGSATVVINQSLGFPTMFPSKVWMVTRRVNWTASITTGFFRNLAYHTAFLGLNH